MSPTHPISGPRGTSAPHYASPCRCFSPGLGGLFSERVGIVNIGLEGMMTFGTWFGGWAGWQWGPWAAIVGGIVGGALAGAFMRSSPSPSASTMSCRASPSTSSRWVLAASFATKLFVGQEGASQSFGPAIKGTLGKFTMPFTSGGKLFGWKTPDTLGVIERHRWFFLSDLAGLFRGLTIELSWLTVIAILLVPAQRVCVVVHARSGFGCGQLVRSPRRPTRSASTSTSPATSV